MSAAMSASTPVAELMMAPARRPRLVRRWELGQLAVRLVSLSLEIISLAEFTFMSLAYQDDHPTNPIANAGVGSPSPPLLPPLSLVCVITRQLRRETRR